MKSFIIFFLSFTSFSSAWSQSDALASARDYTDIFRATEKVLENDPLLQNGIYYAYPYFSAIGHPFPGDGEFEAGDITFRDKEYEGVTINYDIFNQQIILSRKKDDRLIMNLMEIEFISDFSFKGRYFIKANFKGESSPFYQEISRTRNLACYYVWYKERREILDSGNQRVISFSEDKSRRYLLLDGELHRYKNNKSFLQILPKEARIEVKRYLKDNRILVKGADDQVMRMLVEHCSTILDLKPGSE